MISAKEAARFTLVGAKVRPVFLYRKRLLVFLDVALVHHGFRLVAGFENYVVFLFARDDARVAGSISFLYGTLVGVGEKRSHGVGLCRFRQAYPPRVRNRLDGSRLQHS